MSSLISDDLKQRAKRAVISHAFLRFESALTIALTILLLVFLPRPWPWWRWWYWLIFGLLAEGLIVYTSLTDQRTMEVVVGELLRERYRPAALKTAAYREKATQALDYRAQIERTIQSMPVGVLRDHLRDSVADVDTWIGSIYAIAERLDGYEQDALIRRDQREVPASVDRLRKALASEQDPAVRQQIQATLAARQAQLDNLNTLHNRMEQAQFRLEETLTALGVVYSQFQLLNVQKLEGVRARGLQESIRDQVRGLQDLITSMDQAYHS
jgi:hypothetical protein